MDTLFTDLDNEIAELFNSNRDNFCTQIELVPNKKRYFEIVIGSYHSRRFDEKKSREAFFDNGISLSEYYNIAWDLAEEALENKIPNNVYLWGRNTLAIINDKYSENAPPSDYFTRLNKVAIEEYIEGAANCWFYYWLKREMAELENPTHQTIEIEKQAIKPTREPKKITVKCGPAEFTELIKMLQTKGWIELPPSGEGTANSLLKIFDFEGYSPTKESLGKCFANDVRNIESQSKIELLTTIPALAKFNNMK